MYFLKLREFEINKKQIIQLSTKLIKKTNKTMIT